MQALIDSARHIVLIAHEHPDADSLGSACAFYSYLLRSKTKVTLFCVTSSLDQNLSFLPWFDEVTDKFPSNTDLVISFDCGSFGRLGIDYSGELINFDHHISNELYGTHNCIDTQALSTTQIVYEWFVTKTIKINGKMANALYAGLLDDTHCFSDSSCTNAVFEMAHSLIQAGANHALCVEALFHSHSLASFRLKSEMLKRMKILHDGRVAVFEVDQALFASSGALLRDCKAVVDKALSLKTVQIALLVVELKSGGVKVSLRSDGVINAAELLHCYGGGGHKIRAGARIAECSRKSVIKNLMDSIKIALELTARVNIALA
ncbi:MAG: DHH family phosphoesterase [Sulfuricurvum sp.]|nr:DHH family phosphoesterase [Sulfuricurvum sp.]MDD5386240.1 DHH family phosphoesterase [Sulfuricurvum sp.]